MMKRRDGSAINNILMRDRASDYFSMGYSQAQMGAEARPASASLQGPYPTFMEGVGGGGVSMVDENRMAVQQIGACTNLQNSSQRP